MLILFAVLWPAFWLMTPHFLFWMSGDDSVGTMQFVSRAYAYVLKIVPSIDDATAPLLAATLIAIISAIVVLIAVKALDRKAHSKHALWWSLRTLPCLFVWYWSAAICVGLMNQQEARGHLPTFYWLCTAVLVALFFMLPFLSLRRDVLADERPSMLWTPRWPGVWGVLTAIAATAAWIAMTTSLAALGRTLHTSGLAWFILTNLMAWLVGLMFTTGVLTVWLNRWNWRRLISNHKPWLDLTSLRVLAAVELQLGWVLVVLLLPPIIAASVISGFVLPQIEASMHAHGSSIPLYMRAFGSTMHWFLDYWWVFLPPAWIWLRNVSMGRALHLTEATKDQRDD